MTLNSLPIINSIEKLQIYHNHKLKQGTHLWFFMLLLFRRTSLLFGTGRVPTLRCAGSTVRVSPGSTACAGGTRATPSHTGTPA